MEIAVHEARAILELLAIAYDEGQGNEQGWLLSRRIFRHWPALADEFDWLARAACQEGPRGQLDTDLTQLGPELA